MKKFKKYLTAILVIVMTIFFLPWNAAKIIASQIDEVSENLVVKASEGGVVTVVDDEGSHVVKDKFSYTYETGTKVKVEIAPSYNHYIESIVIDGMSKDDYEYDSIYECISIDEHISVIEVVFGEYPNSIPLANGDMVTIEEGNTYAYSGWYTSEYWINAGNYKYLGTCIEPTVKGPKGDAYTATLVSDPIFRYLLWCYQSDEFRDEAFGAVSTLEEQYILMHVAAGYYYCGEGGFGEVQNAGQVWLNRANDVINWIRTVFYGSSEERYVKARTAAKNNFETYIGYGGISSDGSSALQDITWIQPNEVSLTISKRSETDLKSDERYLTGAKFELYAWNGTSYAVKIAESTDNGDGTYTFSNINYMSTVDGKFLVREVIAPMGYQKPYYFYDSNDSSDYSKYGGREFLLDKSYLEWSCESTKDCSDSSVGFTFYNSPNEVTLTITKTDEDTGTKLSGAVFELYALKSDGYTYKVGNFTDNKNGTYSIEFKFDLALKDSNDEYNYLIKETTAPDGYLINSSDKIITYSSNGTLKTLTSELTITNKSETGKLQLKKCSSNTTVTNNNSCYSLEGAEYTVYSDSTCKTSVGVLKTDVSGESNTLSLTVGKYYIKETKSPKGFLVNNEVYEVVLTSAHSSVPYVLDVKDSPGMYLVDVILSKVDSETMTAKPQGFGTLSDAEFTVKYYTAEGTSDPGEAGKTPVRTWILKTDEDGMAHYCSDYLVDGDELYLSDCGEPAIPFGVITVQESKAPEGYQMNNTIYVVPLASEETANNVSAYVIPIIPEDVLELELTKIEFGTGVLIAGAVFEYTRPDGSKETLTADSNGKLSVKGLERGVHTIKEISVIDGYYVNSNEIKFSVDEDNKITILSSATVTDKDGDISVSINADGNVEVVVEDKLVPFGVQIMKMNDKGIALEGAEFTFYADKDCTQIVMKGTTDDKGLLKFSGLIYGNTYYLKETKAPQGYKLPENVAIYEVKGEASPIQNVLQFYVNGVQYTSTDTEPSECIFVSGSASERILNLEMVNNIGLLLPETGSIMTLLCFVVGVMLMGSVFVVHKRQSK